MVVTKAHSFTCHKSAVLTLINGLVPPSICDVIDFLQRDVDQPAACCYNTYNRVHSNPTQEHICKAKTMADPQEVLLEAATRHFTKQIPPSYDSTLPCMHVRNRPILIAAAKHTVVTIRGTFAGTYSQTTVEAFLDDWINMRLATEDYPGVFPPQVAQDVLGSQRRSNRFGV